MLGNMYDISCRAWWQLAWFQWARDTSDSLALQPYSRLAQCQSNSRRSASDMLWTMAAAAPLLMPSSSSASLAGGCAVPFGVAAGTRRHAFLVIRCF